MSCPKTFTQERKRDMLLIAGILLIIGGTYTNGWLIAAGVFLILEEMAKD